MKLQFRKLFRNTALRMLFVVFDVVQHQHKHYRRSGISRETKRSENITRSIGCLAFLESLLWRNWELFFLAKLSRDIWIENLLPLCLKLPMRCVVEWRGVVHLQSQESCALYFTPDWFYFIFPPTFERRKKVRKTWNEIILIMQKLQQPESNIKLNSEQKHFCNLCSINDLWSLFFWSWGNFCGTLKEGWGILKELKVGSLV